MGYLICEDCNGSYELKSGESPNDFKSCQCGGKLKYIESLEEYSITPKIADESYSNVHVVSSNQINSINNGITTGEVKKGTVKRFCTECGRDISESANFCPRCGYNFVEGSENKEKEKRSRTIELVLGIVGGIFGLVGAILAILLGSLGEAFSATGASGITSLGMSALLASIVGIGGSAYVLKNAKVGGIVLIVSGVWLLISISLFGVLGTILLGLAGILAIFRK